MPNVLLHPTPASKRALLSRLLSAAAITARPAPLLLPLPFASDIDREAAWRDVKEMIAHKEKHSLPSLSAADQARLARRWSWLHSRARYIATSASRRGYTHLAMWNGSGSGKRSIMRRAAEAVGLKGIFAELSPFPNYFILDPRGVNAAGSLPADPNFYRSWADQNQAALDFDAFGASMRARTGRRRPNLGDEADGPFVFVPLQVHGDTQISRHGGWIGSIPQLIDRLVEASEQLPNGWKLVFREHPSCRVGNAEQLSKFLGPRVAVDNTTDTFELVRRSKAVITLNSSVGLQSLFFGKPVLVLGQAAYSLPGITSNAEDQPTLAAAMASPLDWSFDETLRQAFLRFLLEEYYVAWPSPDLARLRQQVHLRLEGAITAGHPRP